MSTKRKTDANRRNAQQSTGPKTPQGKAASSRNATRHGLTSAGITVMTSENQEDLDALIATLKNEWNPAGDAESFYVDQMIQARWRLARLARFETEAFNQLLDEYPSLPIDQAAIDMVGRPANAFDKLERYRAAAARTYSTAVRELTQLRANRAKAAVQNKANDDRIWLQQGLQQARNRPYMDPFGWESTSTAADPRPAAGIPVNPDSLQPLMAG